MDIWTAGGDPQGEAARVVGEDGEGRERGQGERAGQPHNSDSLEEFIMFSAFHLMLLSLCYRR